MPEMRCPTCLQPFETTESTSLPFCSDRCRRIDLNRWLNEEVALPAREDDLEDPPVEAND